MAGINPQLDHRSNSFTPFGIHNSFLNSKQGNVLLRTTDQEAVPDHLHTF